jgi:hypothetical protein
MRSREMRDLRRTSVIPKKVGISVGTVPNDVPTCVGTTSTERHHDDGKRMMVSMFKG